VYGLGKDRWHAIPICHLCSADWFVEGAQAAWHPDWFRKRVLQFKGFLTSACNGFIKKAWIQHISATDCSKNTSKGDLIAWLVMAVVQVPGAVANGILAGVNPVLGLLKLGFLMRFISNAVMTSFLSGLGMLTILGQVGDLTEYYSEARNEVFRTIDSFIHFREIDPATLLIGIFTITIIILAEWMRFDRYSLIIALGVITVLVSVVSQESIALVGDSTEIPRSLPIPRLPDLPLIPAMLLPALSIASSPWCRLPGSARASPIRMENTRILLAISAGRVLPILWPVRAVRSRWVDRCQVQH